MKIASLLVLCALTFLAAAKAHGRQVRLERERAGYFHVVFGGTNPRFVQVLWHRERLRFWSLAIGAFALSAAIAIGVRASGRPLPLEASLPIALLAAAFVSLVLAFVVCGGASWVSLLRAGPGGDGDWSRTAILGSAAWWSGVAALFAITSFVATRSSG